MNNWQNTSIENLGWGDYGFRMIMAILGGFSIAIAFTSVYIVSVGYILASFFYWAFTTNLWIPVDYHTWFIMATIPFVNMALIVLALWAIVLKFSIIYIVVELIPMIFHGLVAWVLNIVDHLSTGVSTGQFNGTEEYAANATINFINNIKR